MNHTKTTLAALACLLAFASCGGGDADEEPLPDAPSSSAVPSLTPTPVPPVPLPSDSVAPTPAPTGPAAASPSGVLSLAESCQAVLDDQQDALTAIRDHLRNPLSSGVDMADFDRLRSELLAGELSAPEPLRRELSTQTRVLGSLVQGLQDGDVRQVDVNGFQAATERIGTLCAETGR